MMIANLRTEIRKPFFEQQLRVIKGEQREIEGSSRCPRLIKI
jgi:hypothetical protein